MPYTGVQSRSSPGILPEWLRPLGLSAVLILSPLLSQAETILTPFKAVYKARVQGFLLPVKGQATRELIRVEDEYLFQSFADSLVNIDEQSRFKLVDGKIQPEKYIYKRTGMGKNRDADLTFNWQEGKVLNLVEGVPWKMEVPPGTLDKLVYQLQMRIDLIQNPPTPESDSVRELHYVVADGGRLKDYYFSVLGNETIDTPLGEINALKLQRVRESRKRETLIWLDPQREFLVVKLEQQEKKDHRLLMEITSLEFYPETTVPTANETPPGP